VEAQPEAPIAAAQPATSAAEARPAPVAAEAQLETAVAAPQQEPAATVAWSEAAVVVQQEPALTGSSQATTVEIPADDVPPPGWDQWASLPTPAPEPQAGVLVRRWDSHMVVGGPRHGTEASSSRAAPLPWAKSASMRPPLRRCPRGAAAVGGAPQPQCLTQPLNEALWIHGGPAWHVFQVRRRSLACCFLPYSVIFVFVFAA
jgi:hypothetical protein